MSASVIKNNPVSAVKTPAVVPLSGNFFSFTAENAATKTKYDDITAAITVGDTPEAPSSINTFKPRSSAASITDCNT